jgi:PAS domain S-box-containing protein
VLPALMLFVIVAISVVFFLYARSLRQAQKEQTEGEERFRQMAENIQEIFWMIDAKTKKTLYVNQAYETITGRSRESLEQNPSSYEDAIHAEDRPHVLAKLEEATHSGGFDEKFRIVQPTGEVRWVSVRGFPVRDADGNICRLVGAAQDITAQKQAEEQVAQNLKLAESAWAEAEASHLLLLVLPSLNGRNHALTAAYFGKEDEDVCEALRSLLEDEGIDILLNARLKRVSGKSGDSVSIVIDQDGTEKTLKGAASLA